MPWHQSIRVATSLFFISMLTTCAGRILQHEKAEEALRVDEFDQKLDVKEETAAPVEPPPAPVVKEISVPSTAKGTTKGKKKEKPTVEKPKPPVPPKKKGPRQPEMEDTQGFEGRRPLKDPYRPGEKVIFDISYFNVNAGTLTMEVKSFVTVNGQKAYRFELSGRTNSFFSRIYEVDDRVTTYLSYEDMIPYSLQVSIKESGQLAEARTFFDWKAMRASYWQKRITKEKGERSKKVEWDLLPYSQNVITAPFYLRAFKLEPGKKLAFRVADEGKNIVFTGEVLRREKLKTAIGELDTIVVRPQVTADGEFKPIGEILIWLTDDDRKFFVRLESKIKIGTIVAKLRSLDKGRE
jgi:hypothetical protein